MKSRTHDHQSDQDCFDGSCGKNPNQLKSPTHAPTPWSIRGDAVIEMNTGKRVARMSVEASDFDPGGKKANAAFIVRAVNAHEQLLNALRDVLKTMYANPDQNIDMITNCSTTVKQAIARAEGH